MIKLLKYITKKLETFRCYRHNKWNNFLDKLKTTCPCEKLIK